MLLNELPEEILLYIIGFINNKGIKNLALVNKLFFELTKYNDLMEVNFHQSNEFTKLPHLLTFMRHCHKIKRFIDTAPFCKFYLHEYKELFSNNITHMTLTSCSCSFGKNEIILLLENNKNITNLNLDIGFNIVEYEYFKIISKLKKLTHLKLSNSNVVDFTLKDNVEKLKKLESLSLCYFPNLFLINIFIPTLREISINRCEYIDSEFLNIFLKNHRFLKKIDFSNMNNSINVSVSIAKWCKNITHLNLSYPDRNIYDLDMALICSHCSELVYINLSCTSIGEKTGLYISVGCKKLKTLIVPYSGMNDYGIITILKFIPLLDFLDIRFTLVTKKILKIIKNYPNLSYRVDNRLLQ